MGSDKATREEEKKTPCSEKIGMWNRRGNTKFKWVDGQTDGGK
jgi:hypothetical protein